VDDSDAKTYVATLYLSTLLVSYKSSLPPIWHMNTGVFVSASVYYTASSDPNFNKDYSNNLPINGGKIQGMVYSSDMSSS
jgi:hypothetical protein